MTAIAKNYGTICFQLRNNLYSQLESPLKKDLKQFSDNIKTLLVSGESIKVHFTNILSQVFNIRIKALKWLSLNANFNHSEIFKDISSQIEKLRVNKNLEVLTDNILFALRCNQKVAKSVLNLNGFSPDTLTSNLAQLPDVTYSQFVASLAFMNLDDETTKNFIDFTNASLYIEFVLVATDIINEEKLKVSDKTINELSFLVADAAQEYFALATILGMLKPRLVKQSFSNLSFDDSFIKEEKQFADLGLADFALDLSKL